MRLMRRIPCVVPSRKRNRRRLARCRNRINTATAIDITTTARGAPDHHAIGGNASVAAIEPSDTYRVNHTMIRNNACGKARQQSATAR